MDIVFWDGSKQENTKWELKENPLVIEHMVCRQYEHKLTLDREEVIEVVDKYKAESEEGGNESEELLHGEI